MHFDSERRAEQQLEAALLEADRLAEEAYYEGRFRPVAVPVVEDAAGNILMLQSAKGLEYWGPPQGGIEIEDGESAREAALREAVEESGLDRARLAVVAYRGWQDLPAAPGRVDRRGFTDGKRYFFFRVRHAEQKPSLTVQAKEIADGLWMPPDLDEFEALSVGVRPAKRDMNRRAIFG